MSPANPPPLIAHVIHHLMIGGLENGVVNLINTLPKDRYRHCIVCMTDASPSFMARLHKPDVQVYQIHKKPLGNDLAALGRVYRLFRQLRPAIVHSRNLTALEAQVPASLAGVPIRIHGEHGRDMDDLDGSKRKFQWIRRLYSPFVHQYVALSQDLRDYLVYKVGISPKRIAQIYNGVDAERFAPCAATAPLPGLPFGDRPGVVFGTVGRLQAVKGQLNLLQAFALTRATLAAEGIPIKLVLVGDGPMAPKLQAFVTERGLTNEVHFAGAQDNVPDYIRAFDVFVLPSLAEGISNTVLEAMSTGLPVIASAVGGNPELVADGQSGCLVPAADPQRLAEAMLRYGRDTSLRLSHGRQGRERINQCFSLTRMVANYGSIYDQWLDKRFFTTSR